MKMHSIQPGVALAVFAFGLLAAAATPAQTPACVPNTGVTAPAGDLCGNVQTVGQAKVSEYLGIPFAKPPVRWQNPVAADPLGSFSAVAYGKTCPQPWAGLTCTAGSVSTSLPATQSEDCLTLNVWVPGSPPDPQANLPVMVFIHGGAFVIGSGTAPVFDGSHLAASGNVVVVTLNYRLGALGFLALDQVTDATDNNNFGFRDQLLALNWVQTNIGAFGGDKTNVTIFGESAGAMSVGLHALSSSKSAGLFKAALMESNPLGIPYKTLDQTETIGETYYGVVTGLTGCTDTRSKCLDASHATAPDLLCAEIDKTLDPIGGWKGLRDMLIWTPAIDGTLLTKEPMSGTLGVPLVLGTNRDEGILFVSLALADEKTFGGVKYDYVLGKMFPLPGQKSSVKQQAPYKCSLGSEDCRAQLTSIFTDYLFTCANRHLAATAPNAHKVYLYAFEEVTCFNPSHVGACQGEVCHGDELIYVFDTADTACGCKFNPNEQELSQAMEGYWTSFATSQAPAGTVSWPAFGSDYLVLVNEGGATIHTAQNELATDAICTFWDGIGYGSNDALTRAFKALAKGAR